MNPQIKKDIEKIGEFELNRIYCMDCLEGLKKIPDNSIDICLTDPPYGLQFLGKDWDKAIPKVEVWKECVRVLKPGAFAFIMSSPRQDVLSQMMIRLQEAGFRTDFTSIYWAYADGFPKAMNISLAIDKRAGADRKVLYQKKLNPRDKKPYMPNTFEGYMGTDSFKVNPDMMYVIEPSTDDAKRLDGSFAGFQPKPAVEVIIVVMKPLSESTFVDQALKNGKGVTWLDEARIPFGDNLPRGGYGGMNIGYGKPTETQEYRGAMEPDTRGRFPANLIVSDNVLDDGQERCQGHWSKSKVTGYGEFGGGSTEYFGVGEKQKVDTFSQYFDVDEWFKKTFPFAIVRKPTGSEKHKDVLNIHPTCKPVKLMSYLVTLGSRKGDLVLDPFMGSGTTAVACKYSGRKFIGFEINPEYVKIANKRLAQEVLT